MTAGRTTSTLTGTRVSNASRPSAPRPRFLSEADCRELLAQLTRVTSGGGHTAISIHSLWTGNVRWARNQITTSGETRTDTVRVYRILNGAVNAEVLTNDTSEAGLLAAARRAERLARLRVERPQSELVTRYPLEQPLAPKLFSEATYQLDTAQREAAAVALAKSAAEADMLSAGYIEVSARSQAILDTYDRAWYFPYTQAQYSVTVRDPKGTGSGWAGMDHYDWAKIDGPRLSATALEKCLKSRNPVAIEPGRYTAILEPQAVNDFVGVLVRGGELSVPLSRGEAEDKNAHSPFFKSHEPRQPARSRLGEQVIDERLSLSADPADPELGFPPFSILQGDPRNLFTTDVYHPMTWIEHGVLTNLPYDRHYSLRWLGQSTGAPNPSAFRLSTSGPTSTVEEMISTTKRGLLVTRFDQIKEEAPQSVLCRGHTRDGLWLVENGKISKPVKNMYFTESVMAALNRVEAVGVPQRVFYPPFITPAFPRPPQPAVVPPLKISDFSFTALDDAV